MLSLYCYIVRKVNNLQKLLFFYKRKYINKNKNNIVMKDTSALNTSKYISVKERKRKGIKKRMSFMLEDY
jgi:hypothetical protein